MKLADLTWPDVAKLTRDVVVVYPIGALEQHSRHLPFFTDAILCGAVADRVEAALPNEVLLLPVQWLGASTHHLGMAGTLSAENETHIKLIAEPMRCLLRHGGLALAARRFCATAPRATPVGAFPPWWATLRFE